MNPSSTPIVIMGVMGSGKTTVGRAVAESLGRTFVDADDLHPAANKSKMARAIPLDDSDRIPWLQELSVLLGQGDPVMACSALKRRYRDLLRVHAPHTFFVHLVGDPTLLAERTGRRQHEYMHPGLLDSQLAILEDLEPDERGLVLDIAAPPAELLAMIHERLDDAEARA